MILDYIRLVYNDLKQRKFSSFLTFFAISLGILSIFVIIIISQGFTQSIEQQFEKMGTNKIIISAKTSNVNTMSFSKDLTEKELDLVRSKPYIKNAYPQITRSIQIEYAREFKRISVLGMYPDENYFKEFNVEVENGRFFKENEKYSLVVGPEFAKNTFKKELKLGSNVYISGVKFKIIGILKEVGSKQDDSQVYININAIRDIYNLDKNSIGFGFIVVDENYDVNLAAENIKILMDNRIGKDIIEVMTFQQTLESFNDILTIIKLTLGGIALVSIIVGAIGIINTMYVIVTEKIKEIGIMKSIGATNGNILFLYIFQAGSFGLLGAILGVFFGSIISLVFGSFAKNSGYSFLEITISFDIVIYLLIFGFLIGIIAGYLPARQASKLNVIDAIRR